MTQVRRALLTLSVVLIAVYGAGCATLFSSSNKDVSIKSDPEGATVKVDGEKQGKTPTTVTLDAEDPPEVIVEKNGYESSSENLDNQIGVVWIVLDVAAFGWPLAIDAITGDWFKFEDDSVSVTLDEKEGESAEESIPEEDRPDEDLSAKELFKRGAKRYENEEYEKALIDFKAAHRRSPDPVLLYNVAFSYSKLGKPKKALEAAAEIENPSELPKKVRTKLGALDAANHVIVNSESLKSPDS